MKIPRESVYVPFWARILTLSPATFKTASRRLRHWDDVPPSEQPAVFMVHHTQTPQQRKGVPPIWRFNLNLFVYDNCRDDPAAIPGQRLNLLLDSIDGVLAPNGIDEQTLGGVVSRCWISGPIDIYEGYKGMMDQSVAIIPIEIEVPDYSGAY